MISLEEHAASLPSMGGVQIGDTLRRYAAAVPKGQAIVEVGCWFGAGTAHLALGAMQSGAPIHVYDRWRTVATEVGKAARFGVMIEEGQDTLPIVRRSLDRYPVDIQYHKGDIRNARWSGVPIGLYVDDASKRFKVWAKSAANFLPHITVGGTLILMDFYLYEELGGRYRVQRRFMDARKDQYEQIADHVSDTTAAVFRRVA